MTFDSCIEIILKHEGGYTNNLLDPGGETKFGISKRSYPDTDIKALTYLQAKEIYRKDFWEKLGIHNLPESHRLMYFDCAVNQGPGRARELYGKIKFPKDELKCLEEFAKLRLLHYTSLPGWKTFGAGWAKRMLDAALVSLF